MKREIIYANQFKKDMKLARRRHLPEEELIEVVTDLANDIPFLSRIKTMLYKANLPDAGSVTYNRIGCLYIARNQTENFIF